MTSKSIGSVAADANVLLSAVIGKAARRVFDGAPELRVVTSEVTLAEVRQYLPMMAAKYGLAASCRACGRRRSADASKGC